VQAVAGQDLVRDQVPVGHRVVVRSGQFAAPDAGREPGAVLHDQRVGRDVVGPGGQRRLQRGPPVTVGLPRRAVDQVQADVLEAGLAGPAGTLGRPAGLVDTVQHGQHVRLSRLHAE
jgi:hypothetical protein